MAETEFTEDDLLTEDETLSDGGELSNEEWAAQYRVDPDEIGRSGFDADKAARTALVLGGSAVATYATGGTSLIGQLFAGSLGAAGGSLAAETFDPTDEPLKEAATEAGLAFAGGAIGAGVGKGVSGLAHTVRSVGPLRRTLSSSLGDDAYQALRNGARDAAEGLTDDGMEELIGEAMQGVRTAQLGGKAADGTIKEGVVSGLYAKAAEVGKTVEVGDQGRVLQSFARQLVRTSKRLGGNQKIGKWVEKNVVTPLDQQPGQTLADVIRLRSSISEQVRAFQRKGANAEPLVDLMNKVDDVLGNAADNSGSRQVAQLFARAKAASATPEANLAREFRSLLSDSDKGAYALTKWAAKNMKSASEAKQVFPRLFQELGEKKTAQLQNQFVLSQVFKESAGGAGETVLAPTAKQALKNLDKLGDGASVFLSPEKYSRLRKTLAAIDAVDRAPFWKTFASPTAASAGGLLGYLTIGGIGGGAFGGLVGSGIQATRAASVRFANKPLLLDVLTSNAMQGKLSTLERLARSGANTSRAREVLRSMQRMVNQESLRLITGQEQALPRSEKVDAP